MSVRVDVPPGMVHGDVDEGYGPVADAFRRNFAERDEVGAACAVYRHGRKVVDLWGGYRDGGRGLPWEADTVVVMYSTTKGVASLAVALAHARGLFGWDTPVADYWPEFAWRGKERITVRQLLAHQAGLPVLDVGLTVADLADPDLVAAALALQRPLWEPGTRHGYHAITLGWYESELLRRTDPLRRSLGRFFADEIARPLGLDFCIGVTDDEVLRRRATIHGGRTGLQMLLHLRDFGPRTLAAMLKPGSATRLSVSNPPELTSDTALNTPELLRVEIPAGNGIGRPSAVAAAYDAALTGALGLTPATLEALVRPAEVPAGGDEDVLLKVPARFSLGYLKPTPAVPFGSASDTAFGTPGSGGSFGLADPDTGIGYCYAPNRLGFGLLDEREIAVRQALFHDVLGERPQAARH
ncbi:serine hydrolase domain-containing protein [Spirilliplanes yamanashiensis]|uniref:Esterase n=1 Tax=Spirilliplanes yamanashiensis TaxID=42233 RepID=A0A8J3YDE0_9ACTN|nr:serine hydrolase domain-containing protein [Spirilliplanes yamanashiensis]MDP9818263.1 CubicO group peptidase (beta-lactamase class C family) [Spirilliplanes yamanashiensis]GIJ06681.1 esterase [Spirilliplanes yamanashiensis]